MWVTGVQEKETKMNEMEKIFEEMRQEISQNESKLYIYRL